MRDVRFYESEETARAVELTLAPAAGVEEVFLYKCRDCELFIATDEDNASFLRHRQAGKLFYAVFWATIEAAYPSPRVYYDTTRMYSTEQQLLQSRLSVGNLNAVQAHVYQLTDREGTVIFVVDQYRGQFLPVDHKSETVLARYYTTYCQSKLPGPMS